MDLIIGKKIKIFGCQDEFIIEEIDNSKLFVCKIRTGSKVWINNIRVEKIIKD